MAQVAETAGVSFVRACWKESPRICAPFHLAYLAVFLSHGALCLRLRPYARPRDSVYELLSTTFLCAAMLCRAIGYFDGDRAHWAFTAGAVSLLLAFATLATKAALDIACVLWRAAIKRRRRLQREVDAGEYRFATPRERAAARHWELRAGATGDGATSLDAAGDPCPTPALPAPDPASPAALAHVDYADVPSPSRKCSGQLADTMPSRQDTSTWGDERR
eukprot:gene3623-26888_t